MVAEDMDESRVGVLPRRRRASVPVAREHNSVAIDDATAKAGEEMAASLGEAAVTKDVTAQAWRTALNPQGEWIPAVLGPNALPAYGGYDPMVNAQAALALYFRSGGWGPWGG